MNSSVCKFYLRGSCKYGNRCKYLHQPSYAQIVKSVVLPKEVLALIFETYGYIGDLRPVCKSWKNIVDELFPLRLYVFTRVMNGCYTQGNAFAIARCRLDAILNICQRYFNTEVKPKCSKGTWCVGDSESSHRFMKSILELKERATSNSELKHFSDKMFKFKKEMKIYDEKNANLLYSCDLFLELIKCTPDDKQNRSHYYRDIGIYTILPLNRSMGFFYGGGS